MATEGLCASFCVVGSGVVVVTCSGVVFLRDTSSSVFPHCFLIISISFFSISLFSHSSFETENDDDTTV